MICPWEAGFRKKISFLRRGWRGVGEGGGGLGRVGGVGEDGGVRGVRAIMQVLPFSQLS